PELAHRFSDGATAADGTCRPVEGGEEAVPRGVHLLAAEAHELATYELVMALQQLAPTAVAECGRLLARADDVAKEDGGEHTVGLGRLVRLPGSPEKPLHLRQNRLGIADRD